MNTKIFKVIFQNQNVSSNLSYFELSVNETFMPLFFNFLVFNTFREIYSKSNNTYF